MKEIKCTSYYTDDKLDISEIIEELEVKEEFSCALNLCSINFITCYVNICGHMPTF
ncbi:hypothetical protein CPAST_c04810 [Clostridium pasteurianum DSM 525 = ATCC 6013]|uniref:Uncharacterized protein n=1 Tax=Clostridium pasteurianum DSM 525 = ATCC 6013 TaxID=1262449 RepID=A0A0H3IYI8_CLOPA|nr:hypothetical protein [Clostridium pasteurianum]AJA46581.1 hypothetical protein CPAST_c04810 [Clostridium pasteurianum DSM 525 = ATCC 6013]AJA50569.1 hypothetical protein CLPA_c04810 [Clostridium pasteurianum DSM 525 = ATCC 6013]KRU13419.1 hypothetical protein CP6013_02667 [Clostridium pasteurianum DSM 525 = ATCC 6013]